MIIIIDSWAWLAVTEDKFADLILKYLNDRSNKIYTTVLNLYELYYIVKQKSSEETARQFIESVKNKSEVLPIDEDLAILSSEVHLKDHLSAIDSFVYAAALKSGGSVLTGDPHFKGKTSVIFISQ